ncbi:MAG: TIGR00730 family Rossman fold protein [Halobacteriovoraceae bacterium]|jgi:uncharacterized protein (TIGR00730 family)|nr:TIGR00730 family Rossman fold protein [Halobacteriovoraceae bacterium]
MKYKTIGVMCGSSDACDSKYLKMAYQLGQKLAQTKHEVIYGGGAKGLMRQVADGALDNKGIVHGYIPQFMIEVEWQHPTLTNLHITADMSERKSAMMSESDATIFLPGGCGTMEEFFEWLSAKRLGRYLGPLIIVNFEGYYDPLVELLLKMETEKFHNSIHNDMWSVCHSVDEIHNSLEAAPSWQETAIAQAAVKK